MPITRLLLAIATMAAVGYAGWELASYPARAQAGTSEVRAVSIAPGSSLPRIAESLASAGVVERPLWFRAYVRREGSARQIKAGTYRLPGNLSPSALLAELLKGQADPGVRLTIAPGIHALDIAKLLDAAGIVSAPEFLEAFRSEELRTRHGVHAPNLEGRLYPDTYHFRPGTPAESIIETLVTRHRAVLSELQAAHPEGLKRLQSLGFDEDDIVTLASIVEKETAAAKERPRIASVFLNRLERGSFQPKLLQTDPTVAYGCVVPQTRSEACRSFEGRLRTVHLRDRDNAYNTYAHPGLPPGPIASPGRAALQAVLAPESHDYFYFVSQNNGTHAFSKTVAQHERMVDRYQRR